MDIICAVSENGVIGSEGKLPWYIPEDLKWFKNITVNRTVVMGRNTWESIGLLPNRRNVVITSVPIDGVTTYKSLQECAYSESDIIVIGGARLFEEAMHSVDKVYLTRIHKCVNGDTFFEPNLSGKECIYSRQGDGYTFYIYQ